MDDTLIIILIILAVLFLGGWWYRSRGGAGFNSPRGTTAESKTSTTISDCGK
jgi:hypothetical protein